MAVGNIRKVIKFAPTLLIMVVLVFFMARSAQAADFIPRSMTLSSALPSVTTGHNFNFTYPSLSLIGSMSFEYCTNSPFEMDPCTAPAGLNVSGASLSSQSGNTGFSFDSGNTTANRIVTTRAPAMTSMVASTYNFAGIVNPSTAGQTVFVRIASYITADATGARTDKGTVAFATASAFNVSAYVPPYLTFCVGVTVSINCSTTTGSQVNLNEFQVTVSAAATTQFSGATNDFSGYTVYISGATMTSGNNTIPALSTNSASNTGTSQFGINVRANSNPAVGADPDGTGTINPTANYGTPNSFRFVSGEAVATSNISTDFRRFTTSYVVNVAPSQPAGFYATTVTYTAIASF